MSDQPTVHITYEFHFAGGETLSLDFVEGRDTYQEDSQMARLEMFPDPDTTIVVSIEKAKLNATQALKRIIHPDPNDVNGVNGTKVV